VGFKLLAVSAAVFVALAAGCGGSKKKSASGTTSSGSPKFATAQNCAQLEALGTKLGQALQATSGSAESRLTHEAKLLQDYANAAPSDVRGDFQTLASAFATYVHALVEALPNPGTPPTAAQVAQVQAATKAFDTPKLRAAERHLSAWAHENCVAAPRTTG
jgi:hypothetical protein